MQASLLESPGHKGQLSLLRLGHQCHLAFGQANKFSYSIDKIDSSCSVLCLNHGHAASFRASRKTKRATAPTLASICCSLHTHATQK
eukprot:1145324-Pelagomonas_calceolata.AAC.3